MSGRSSAARSRETSSPDGDLAERGQIGVGQHGKRDVAMPSSPGADLVLIETDLALGGLEASLDWGASVRIAGPATTTVAGVSAWFG